MLKWQVGQGINCMYYPYKWVAHQLHLLNHNPLPKRMHLQPRCKLDDAAVQTFLRPWLRWPRRRSQVQLELQMAN